jgi:hypothetical protein
VVTGNFIMTMLLPIQHNLCRGFFGKTLHHPGQAAPLQPRFTSLQLLAFPKAKIAVKREEIKENVTRQLMAIPKEDLADCFEKWKGRWDKCDIPQTVL